jgi:glycosyltransferase involved in cell wall biosynthesis
MVTDSPHRAGKAGPDIVVAVLAHNEERRIAACLASLPLGEPGIAVHVVVNGSCDRTAAIARAVGGAAVTVHDWPEGGKSRSWNRLVLDTPINAARAYVFVDGDAEVAPGSIAALVRTLAANPAANAAAGLPCNGRRAEHYRKELIASHGLFGDLYALSANFVDRLRASGIRLPDDLIGDDGLIGALAKTDLGALDNWQDERVQPCPDAGFVCEPARLGSLASLTNQYRRMVAYSLRHFQNRMITAILRETGPHGLPRRMATLYPRWLKRLRPRAHPVWCWFDLRALARIRASVSASKSHLLATIAAGHSRR